MKKARSLLFSLIILSLGIFPTLVHARMWRFEVGALAVKTDYTEIHTFQSFLDKDFSQTSVGLSMEFQWAFIPKWFYFNLEVDYVSPMSANSTDEYTTINQISQIALTLPAKPLNLALVAEQSYNQMKTNTSAFGYDDYNAIQFFPQLDFTTPGGLMTVYGKMPLINLLDTEKKEFSYGVIFRLSDKSAAWPEYYFLPGWNLKVEYKELEFIFNDITARPVTIKTQDIALTLSYSF